MTSTTHIQASNSVRTQSPLWVVCSVLVAAPWFWPMLIAPLTAMWPDLFAWTCGALLVSLLPWTRGRASLALAVGWLIAAVGSAVLGLMQYFDLENGFYPWIGITRPGYTTANVHQLNMLATLLAVGLLSLWWLHLRGHVKTMAAVPVAALLVIALAATASRTGMVHLILISGLLLYWHRDHWRKVLVGVAIAFALYALAASTLPWLVWVTRGIDIERDLFSRFGQSDTCHSRRVLWRNMLELIQQKPWTGWGPGELLYAHYITPFESMRFCEKLSNAHNLPLHLAVTLGVPLAVLVVVLGVLGVFRLKPWLATDPMERMCWGVLILVGAHSMLEYPLWFGVFQLMVGLACWQIYSIRRVGTSRNAATGSMVRFRLLFSAAALSGLALVAWDYLKVSQLYLPAERRMERYRDDTFEKARTTVLFKSYVLIPQIVVMELNAGTANLILEGALASLHVAPDSRVIRRVIEAAELAGKPDLAQLHTARYKAAWPDEYEEWAARRGSPATR